MIVDISEENYVAPLYVKIKNYLLRQIRDGSFEENQRIPSEKELCEYFNVSRPTVRQATQELVNAGLLFRKRGKGTYVSQKPKVTKRLNDFQDLIKGFTERMVESGKKASSKVLKKEIIDANNVEFFIFKQLKLEINEKILYLSRLRLADGIPVLVENVHLQLKRFPNIDEFDFTSMSLFELLRKEYNCSINGLAQTLKPILLDRENALLLGTKEGDVAMYSNITTYDQNNEPIASTYSINRADHWHYCVEFKPQVETRKGGYLLEQVDLSFDNKQLKKGN